MSGIRYGEEKDHYKIELRILETAKKMYGLSRIDWLDITMLPDEHPEVQAILRRDGPESHALRVVG